jgi:hypothetical protein
MDMKKSLGALSALFVLVAVVGLTSLASADDKPKFNAHLTGGEEVPARETMAHGQANLQLTKDGSALGFKLIVANIDNVLAAHIHCGAVGVNGPIGVTLFMVTPGGGAVTGPLAEGTITAPDAGNGCGWADLAAVLAAIESGNTYINVHTDDGLAPANTGPGDFPGGEIRGQVQ